MKSDFMRVDEVVTELDSLAEVLEELKRINTGVQPSDELLEDIALITTTLNGIKGGKNA